MKGLPPSVDLSLLIPAKSSAHCIEETIEAAYGYLKSRFAGTFEIIVIPTPAPGDFTEAAARASLRGREEIRVLPHPGPLGKGAALRTGMAEARGKWIAFTDADLPYDLDFLSESMRFLEQGTELVTGNRRLPSSHVRIPVPLLHLAQKRHRAGRFFNFLIRALFSIRTTDTQAGIKAMTRDFARGSFARIQCPGFFFDVELFLYSSEMKRPWVELPVTLRIDSDRSTVRLFQQSVLAAFWLFRIAWSYVNGRYGPEFEQIDPRRRGAIAAESAAGSAKP